MVTTNTKATVKLPDGTKRRLGNNPGKVRLKWGMYGATPNVPKIERSKWDGIIKEMGEGPEFYALPPIHDQDGVGQCNADSTTLMGESCRMDQGLPAIELSAADLYDRINGGADNGSLLEDAIAEMMANGCGTAATSGKVWKRGNPKASKEERAKFRILEAYLYPDFDSCMSAVLLGFRLSTGIMWYNNYETGPDGWLPAGRGQAGGHAIMGYKGAKKGSVYGIWHQNSWGVRWGLDGRMCIPEGAYRGPVGGWWAIRSMVDEGGVIPMLKATPQNKEETRVQDAVRNAWEVVTDPRSGLPLVKSAAGAKPRRSRARS